MISKEKPDFFEGSRKYYSINITNDMREKVLEINRSVDHKDERSENRSSEDSKIGYLAEVVVKRFLEERGNNVKFSDDWEYDLLVNGNKVEVKTRDYSQTSPWYNDLLVRDRSDTNWDPGDVDYIIQVMVNGARGDKAYITGYCTGEKASKADFFEKAKTYRTRKIQHKDLTSFDDENIF